MNSHPSPFKYKSHPSLENPVQFQFVSLTKDSQSLLKKEQNFYNVLMLMLISSL